MNGGFDVGSLNQPKCECPVSYIGERCEIPKCNTVICQNNGTCQQDASATEGFRCECTSDYYGKFCEINRSNGI